MTGPMHDHPRGFRRLLTERPVLVPYIALIVTVELAIQIVQAVR